MKFAQQLSILLFSILWHTGILAISNQDKAFRALVSKQWLDAERCACNMSDTTIWKIVQSQKFLQSSAKDSNFQEIVSFIKQNPDWPEIKKIERAAENTINDSTKKEQIVEWFKDRDPITDNGAKYYAIASMKLVQDSHKLQRIIQNGWIYGNFTNAEEKAFLSANHKYLTSDNHTKKIDYLLWAGNTSKAMELLKLVNQETRTLFKAAISIIQGCSNHEQTFEQLDDRKKHHSILLYSYLKLHEKDEIISDKLVKLISHAPRDRDHASEWWKLKAKFIRNLIKQRKYQSAYSIAINHHANASEDISEAEFIAGWLALRFVNKPSEALRHFNNLRKAVKQPISLSRATYWLGRTELVLGNKENAHKWFREAAAFNHTFYGQLALLEIGNHTITLPKAPKITEINHKNIAKNEIARAAKLLFAHNMSELGLVYVKSFMTKTKSAEEAAIMMNYIREYKGTPDIISMAKAASYNGILLVNDAFPVKYKVHNKFIEQALALAIIRQETVFDQYAVSNRNAHGLMQLLPETACATAKSLKIRCKPKQHLLSDPHYNIALGTKTFKDSIDEFHGSTILAIIAYNAGPHKSREWVETYGDLRLLKNRYAIIDWIETIPYYETRNYVQRVLENLQVYRVILGQSRDLRLLSDMGVPQKK
jgi:soluble lytic murein transglycosylase